MNTPNWSELKSSYPEFRITASGDKRVPNPRPDACVRGAMPHRRTPAPDGRHHQGGAAALVLWPGSRRPALAFARDACRERERLSAC